MNKQDTFVKVIRGFADGKSFYKTVIYSKNPNENPKIGAYKQFNLEHQSENKDRAELYAHKLAQCLSCGIKDS